MLPATPPEDLAPTPAEIGAARPILRRAGRGLRSTVVLQWILATGSVAFDFGWPTIFLVMAAASSTLSLIYYRRAVVSVVGDLSEVTADEPTDPPPPGFR